MEGKLPANAQAIKDWILANRPDLADQADALMNNNGSILLLTIGFEAGRKYQADNKEKELSDRNYLDQ